MSKSGPIRPVPTIRDVAAHAGVSIKTVSRILNNSPNLSSKIIAKVRASMEALSYRPDLNARNLAGASGYLIALLSARFTMNGYVASLQSAAYEVCDELHFGFLQQISNFYDPGFSSEQVVQAMLAKRVSGVLVIPPLCDRPEFLNALDQYGLRYACISPLDPERTKIAVNIDEQRAANEMTSYLLELGHKRIAFIGAAEGHGAASLRFQGYLQALQARGISVNPDWVAPGDFTVGYGRSAAAKFLSLPQPPSAIMAANDDMAAGVLQEAHRRGLRIPEDLSVTGFDDSPVVEFMWPRLTTVRQPITDMAKVATRSLIEGLRSASGNEPPETRIMFPHSLVIRASTGRPAGN